MTFFSLSKQTLLYCVFLMGAVVPVYSSADNEDETSSSKKQRTLKVPKSEDLTLPSPSLARRLFSQEAAPEPLSLLEGPTTPDLPTELLEAPPLPSSSSNALLELDARVLDIQACAKPLGEIIQRLQKEKEGDLFVKVSMHTVPEGLKAQLSPKKRGRACAYIRELYEKKTRELADAQTTQSLLNATKEEIDQRVAILEEDLRNTPYKERRFILEAINGVYSQYKYTNKAHFLRVFPARQARAHAAVGALTAEQKFLATTLEQSSELAPISHQEVIDYLYRHPNPALDIRHPETLTIVKTALENFFPE